MDIQQLLRWIVIALVMVVAVVLLNFVLGIVGSLLHIALPRLAHFARPCHRFTLC